MGELQLFRNSHCVLQVLRMVNALAPYHTNPQSLLKRSCQGPRAWESVLIFLDVSTDCNAGPVRQSHNFTVRQTPDDGLLLYTNGLQFVEDLMRLEVIDVGYLLPLLF